MTESTNETVGKETSELTQFFDLVKDDERVLKKAGFQGGMSELGRFTSRQKLAANFESIKLKKEYSEHGSNTLNSSAASKIFDKKVLA